MKNERNRRHSYVEDGTTVGFLTDPTLCIGCKACEVACREWNDVPADGGPGHSLGQGRAGHSYDHTGELGASSWRHVKFVEQETEAGLPRWLFLSDVCKHCEHAGCLEACPTGAIWRTEVGSVLVDDDRCNGCGYCVVSCPFGVIGRRGRPSPDTSGASAGGAGELDRAEAAPSSVEGEGGAFKCTFCYDRQVEGKIPACANACPTDSILFGALDDLKSYASQRVETLVSRGVVDAMLYDASHTNVGGAHALSILVGAAPEQVTELWAQPKDPVAPSAYLRSAWTSAVLTVAFAAAGCWMAFSL